MSGYDSLISWHLCLCSGDIGIKSYQVHLTILIHTYDPVLAKQSWQNHSGKKTCDFILLRRNDPPRTCPWAKAQIFHALWSAGLDEGRLRPRQNHWNEETSLSISLKKRKYFPTKKPFRFRWWHIIYCFFTIAQLKRHFISPFGFAILMFFKDQRPVPSCS